MPFPGNVIPANRIDPVALALLQRVPLPNAAGLVNNLLVPENARADRYDQHVVKVDQVINANHRFFVRFARNKRTEVNDYAAFPPEASPWYQHGRMNVGFAVEGTSVLSPSLVLSSRAGFIRHDFYIATHGDNFDPSDARLPVELHLAAPAPDVPADPVGRLHHLRQHVRRQQRQHLHRQRHVVVVRGAQQDDRQPLAQVRRRDARAGQQPAEPDLVVRGASPSTARFTQRNRWRPPRRSGSSVASLLLGYPADGSTTDGPSVVADLPAAPLPRELLRPVRPGRLADQLAADAERRPPLGLRVAGRRGAEPAEHRLRHDVAEPVPGARALADAAGCCSRATSQRMPFKKDLNNIQPRVGATFRVDDKTVLRGGYALAYLPTFDNGYNNGFSVTTTLVASTDGGITPTGRLSNPYPGRARPAGRQLAGALDAGRPRLHLLGSGADHSLRAPVLGRRAARAAGPPGAGRCRTSAAARAACRCRRGSTRSPPSSSRPAPSCSQQVPNPYPGPPAGDALQRRHGAAAAARASVLAVRLDQPRIAGRSASTTTTRCRSASTSACRAACSSS